MSAQGCPTSLLPGCEAGLVAVGTAEGAGTAGARGCGEAVRGCQAAGLFSAEETERCEKGEGESAGGASAHVAPPRAAASLCPAAHFHRDSLGEQLCHRTALAKGVPWRGPSRVTLLLGVVLVWATSAGSWGHPELTGPVSPPTPGHLQEVPDPMPTPGAGGEHHGHLQRHHCQH